eukprot:10871021-Alexandrium_andersonii.AAC.1
MRAPDNLFSEACENTPEVESPRDPLSSLRTLSAGWPKQRGLAIYPRGERRFREVGEDAGD